MFAYYFIVLVHGQEVAHSRPVYINYEVAIAEAHAYVEHEHITSDYIIEVKGLKR